MPESPSRQKNAKRLDPNTQKAVAVFLCYSEYAKYKVYRNTESRPYFVALHAVESMAVLQTGNTNANSGVQMSEIESATPTKVQKPPPVDPPSSSNSIVKSKVRNHLIAKFGDYESQNS